MFEAVANLSSCYSLQQQVTSTTHVQEHTLDLLITRYDQTIVLFAINPPLLSYHSLIVADCDHAPPATTMISFHPICNWQALYIDAFAADLQTSELLAVPIINV